MRIVLRCESVLAGTGSGLALNWQRVANRTAVEFASSANSNTLPVDLQVTGAHDRTRGKVALGVDVVEETRRVPAMAPRQSRSRRAATNTSGCIASTSDSGPGSRGGQHDQVGEALVIHRRALGRDGSSGSPPPRSAGHSWT